jgi:hypothetical protein
MNNVQNNYKNEKKVKLEKRKSLIKRSSPIINDNDLSKKVLYFEKYLLKFISIFILHII